MKGPLLDLRAQYQAIRDEISFSLERVLEAQCLHRGRKLPGLRKDWHRIRIDKIRMLLRVNFKERTRKSHLRILLGSLVTKARLALSPTSFSAMEVNFVNNVPTVLHP
jgi:hypothetical protein